MVSYTNAAPMLHKMNPVRRFFTQVSSMIYQAKLMTTLHRTNGRFFRLSESAEAK